MLLTISHDDYIELKSEKMKYIVSELVYSQAINKSTQLSIMYVQIVNLLHNCLRGKNIFPLQKVCTLLQYFSHFYAAVVNGGAW